MLTVFIVIVAEDWNQVMYLYVRAMQANSSNGRPFAIAFFIGLFIVGNTILLALFTALLLKSQENAIEQEVLKKESEMVERAQSFRYVSTESVDAEEGNPCKKIKRKCSR